MVQFQLSSVQTQRQTPRRIAVSLPWFHHPGILVILTSSYMYWPTGAYPQAPRCAHKMVDGVPDWEKRFTNSKLTTEFYCNKKKTCNYVPSGWKKRGICWPVSRDHIMGSSLELIEITWVFENWPLTCAALFYWITGSCRVMSCQGRVVRKKQQTSEFTSLWQWSYLKTKKWRAWTTRHKLQQLTFLCVRKLTNYSPERFNARMVFSEAA